MGEVARMPRVHDALYEEVSMSYSDLKFAELLRRLKSLQEEVVTWNGSPPALTMQAVVAIVRELNAYGIDETDPRMILNRFFPPKEKRRRVRVAEVIPEPVEPIRDKTEIEKHLEALTEEEAHVVGYLERIGDEKSARAAKELYAGVRARFFKPSRFHET
ncbi:MAG: hypothetical protein Q8L86_12370 [Vicinamibacterales bacterium]|nr:hypothetical protein [Vicinamibacterales bacterium]